LSKNRVILVETAAGIREEDELLPTLCCHQSSVKYWTMTKNERCVMMMNEMKHLRISKDVPVKEYDD